VKKCSSSSYQGNANLNFIELGMVEYLFNPSYSGSRERENQGSGLSMGGVHL
jgi:hypothetical protein